MTEMICGLEFRGTDAQMEHSCEGADGTIQVTRFRGNFRARILQFPWIGFGETRAEAVEFGEYIAGQGSHANIDTAVTDALAEARAVRDRLTAALEGVGL